MNHLTTRTYVQEKDYFFLSDAGYQELVPVLTKQLVLPKEEFQYHPYKTIHVTSCYQMWNIRLCLCFGDRRGMV